LFGIGAPASAEHEKAPVRGPWWRRRAGEKAARGNADARQMGGIRNGPRREDAKNPVRCPDRASFVRFQFLEIARLAKMRRVDCQLMCTSTRSLQLEPLNELSGDSEIANSRAALQCGRKWHERAVLHPEPPPFGRQNKN
jgi:hypothetical protein